MSILILEELNAKSIELALNSNCTKLTFANGNPNLLYGKEELENVPLGYLDSEASWDGWKIAEETVESLFSQIPEIFQLEGVDFRKAVVKALWWNLFNTKGRLIRYARYFLEQNEEVFIHTSLELPKELKKEITLLRAEQRSALADKTKILIKGVLYSLNKDTLTRPSSNSVPLKVSHTGGLVLFPTSVGQIEFLSNLLKQFNTDKVQACLGIVPVIDPANKIISFLRELRIPLSTIPKKQSSGNIKKIIRFTQKLISHSKKIKQIVGDKEGYAVEQTLLDFLPKVLRYKLVCRLLNPEVFLTNAAECSPTADLLIQVAHLFGAKVVNTMNGLKTPSPKNNDTRFDAWCVWNEKQKRMLVEKNRAQAERLVVTGHLQADTAVNYKYQGILNPELEKCKGKKIIAIFSQPPVFSGSYREKFLYTVTNYIKNNNEVCGFFKPHPRETTQQLDILKRYAKNEPRVILLEHNILRPITQLCDLLYVADLSVVMFSTVSLESLFFRTPVISLNYTGIPGLLPIVNGKYVLEATNEFEFKKYADELLDEENKNRIPEKEIEEIGLLDGKCTLRTATVIRNFLE
jgi:hypothetical protein